MPERPTISAVILSCNEADVIRACLESVNGWVEEIVVVDMYSQDGTVEIAKQYTDKIHFHERVPIVELARNCALAHATHDWILLLDPDEQVMPGLRDELLTIAKKPDIDMVIIPRVSRIWGRIAKGGFHQFDEAPRFFRRGCLTWPEEIHAWPDMKGLSVVRLNGRHEGRYLLHDPWRDVHSVLQKGFRYVDCEPPTGSHFSLVGGAFEIFRKAARDFLDLKGYVDGTHGLASLLLQIVYHSNQHLLTWQRLGYPVTDNNTVVRYGRVARIVWLSLRWLSRIARFVSPAVKKS